MAFAFANVAASSTDEELVAARTNLKIRVYAAFVAGGDTATDVTFNTKPSGSGTAITPLLALDANGDMVLPQSFGGWFETEAGEGLSVTTGTGSTQGVHVVFQYLPASA